MQQQRRPFGTGTNPFMFNIIQPMLRNQEHRVEGFLGQVRKDYGPISQGKLGPRKNLQLYIGKHGATFYKVNHESGKKTNVYLHNNRSLPVRRINSITSRDGNRVMTPPNSDIAKDMIDQNKVTRWIKKLRKLHKLVRFYQRRRKYTFPLPNNIQVPPDIQNLTSNAHSPILPGFRDIRELIERYDNYAA